MTCDLVRTLPVTYIFVCLLLLGPNRGAELRAQSFGGSIGSGSFRPFVISVTPVIGANGAIGGVAVDAEGAIRRQTPDDVGRLQALWRGTHQPVPSDIGRAVPLRCVSLKRLSETLREAAERELPLTEEIFFLAGLQRVEYVFVYPEERDIVLAGPAEGWQMNATGDVVGVTTGRPVLRLDDLVEALRSAEAARRGGITCSIEPTAEGLERYARLARSRRLEFGPEAIRALQDAIGPQQVLLRGIPSDSHFARVIVAADFLMKRLAMGFEPAPVQGMPSYLELLQASSTRGQISSPRWWMTVNYEPLLRAADGLAWQLRGQGVKTLTEDSRLDAQGQRQKLGQPNPLAEQWAETMTDKYDELATQLPVFDQLRNCMDLAVVAALIVKEDLRARSGCQLGLLLNEAQLKGRQLNIPKSVESQASFVRGRGGWIVTLSGGVDIASWSVVDRVEIGEVAKPPHGGGAIRVRTNWWW